METLRLIYQNAFMYGNIDKVTHIIKSFLLNSVLKKSIGIVGKLERCVPCTYFNPKLVPLMLHIL